MKTVFCIDDNPRYLLLLQVAVRSLRAQHGEKSPCVCIYAGENQKLMETLERENITLARYKPLLSPDKIPAEFHRCIGCFLKLELALVPELANDDMVLYCDTDVFFIKPLDALFTRKPAYMAMAKESTIPFFHEHQKLSYSFRGREYVVPMPFPIWTFSSGVALFNLSKLRSRDLIYNFLAFCEQNVKYIGNMDQSLLNYFFGRRIERLEDTWNRPPYHADAMDAGHIIHFHGPKPWDVNHPYWKDLRINNYFPLREAWMKFLSPEERELLLGWEREVG